METRNPLDITIRQAGLDDAASITSLCIQLGYPAVEEDVQMRLGSLLGENEHIIFVAELPGEGVVGWVHGYIYKLLYSGLMTEVAGLIVDNAYRGKGIGKELMMAVEGWAKENNCIMVGLRSNIIRKEAHIFYKNIGYDLVKEQYTFRKRI